MNFKIENSEMILKIFNSLSGKLEGFKPISPKNIRMYVCGPTVYDRPHIGNARAVVVYDLLFRLLREIYGENSVTYVRNITDVDDKINKAAIENAETIQSLTSRIIDFFHKDMAALNNLSPTFEPKVTEYISEIINLIQKILDNNHAYIEKNHVLLDISSLKNISQYNYGMLSGKKLEDLIAGARVGVEDYKRNPEDFVLWKPADVEDDASSVFDSPWGKGRPGWHIECSAMSSKLLGDDFDIHGGGADLKFPHHENEIAQSRAANHHCHYAKYWVHNGFVTVNGEKMSKSLGNFTTVSELLEKGIKGEVIRLTLLMAHYRKPLDFNDKLMEDAEKTLNRLYDIKKTFELNNNVPPNNFNYDENVKQSLDKRGDDNFKLFMEALFDDMNTPLAISHLYTLSKCLRSFNSSYENYIQFQKACDILGVCQQTPSEWFDAKQKSKIDVNFIEAKINERLEAKKNKNFSLADAIRTELEALGIKLKDTKEGTDWGL
jgi:cysteinyl-tRNA synthetase